MTVKRAKQERMELEQAEAARVILADPSKHAGLPLLWAEAWAAHHPKQMGTPLPEEPSRTLEEWYGMCHARLAEAREREWKRRIHSRRERWQRRKWWKSAKGNFVLNTSGFRVVVFFREGYWRICVTHRLTGETRFSPKQYLEREIAQAESFDVLLYMQSRCVNAAPELRERVGWSA